MLFNGDDEDVLKDENDHAIEKSLAAIPCNFTADSYLESLGRVASNMRP